MATRSRSSSVGSTRSNGPTFVNFSTPGRTLSMTSDTYERWREHVEGTGTTGSRPGTAKKEDDAEQVLPYRPVKNQIVQLHVTSSVTSVTSVASSLPVASVRRPSFSNTSRPNYAKNASQPNLVSNRPSLDDTSKVLVNDPAKVLVNDTSKVLINDTAKVLVNDTAKVLLPTRTASLRKNDKLKDKAWPNNVRPPPPSPGGSYRFPAAPTLTRTPWEIERGRPGSRWLRATGKKSNSRVLRELPREIYQCIIDHVEMMHVHQGSLLDVPSSRADLRALCLVDRRWNHVAREALYRHLWLPSDKVVVGKKKFLRQPKKSKLRLLLHTLCTSPSTAFLVYNMHIATSLAEEIQAEGSGASKKESVFDVVNQMIRQCYNLERMTGYIPETTSASFPLFQALATRTRLRAHAWYLDSSKTLPNLGTFVNCHDQWKNLESLVIAADTDVDLGKVAVSAILGRLHSLKHLMLSGLHRDDFHNGSLLALPTLKSLRLEKLAGVTDQGIQQLAFSRLAPSLERLSLVGLELTSLETIQTLLLHLTGLTNFVFVQDTSPEPQLDAKKFLILASTSLQYLHWDCLVPRPTTTLSRLASAISANHFPRLRKVKIPCDINGEIQRLCRPIPRVKLTHRDINYYLAKVSDRYERNLRVSRIQAQMRLRDEGIGMVESKVEYCLSPGVEGGGMALAGFGEIQRPRGSGMEGLDRRLDLGSLF